MVKGFKITSVSEIDYMEGHIFEFFCAEILEKNSFTNVSVTKGSGDQGIDILAFKDGVKYAIQCKNYSTSLGNSPIQEVFAGKTHYGCHVAVVMTNSTFTQGAKELAKSTGVLLWDRSVLQEMINTANVLNSTENIARIERVKARKVENKPSSIRETKGAKVVARQTKTNKVLMNKKFEMRKNMKIWMIVCFCLALTYIWASLITEPFIIAGTAFFGVLGIMFLILGLTAKESECVLGKEKIKKKPFVISCVTVAFMLFGIIADALQSNA